MFLFIAAVCQAATFSLYDLTCEQEVNPIGLDTHPLSVSWKIFATERGFVQSAYRILVADNHEALSAGKGNIWDSGKTSSEQSVLVALQTGGKLKSFRRYYWKAMIWDNHGVASDWSVVQSFSMGLLSASDWGKAVWIALEADVKDEIFPLGFESIKNGLEKRIAPDYKMPLFRRSLTVGKELKSAVAYIAGVGHFDLFLNGNKVGNHFLDAGWTKYDKQALYVSFDITDKLKQGENALCIMLGNGFYNMPKERYLKLVSSFGAPKMKMLLRLEFEDGKTEEIVSDASWRVTESPITFSSIFGGEDYDARREQHGRMEEKNMQKPVVADNNIVLKSMRATPLTVHSSLQPVKIFKNSKGFWIYDFGQNASGIINVSLQSAEGKKITFRPAELLNPDSTVNQSATGQPFEFNYTASGSGETETWQPQFTYYGFRYVQVEGAVPQGAENHDALPKIMSLQSLHTCNSAPETGSFVCSKPIFNQIHTLIDWAIRSNMASVLTDCPHREKLGWLEQAHLMQFSLQYRYNLARLYPKIMNDMLLSQRDNGCIPTIAPEYVRFANGFEDTPEWGSSFIISPWYIYQWYGDRRLLEEYYPAMQKYLDYLTSRAENHIVAYGLGDWFDIGPKRPGYAQLTSNALSATAIYYYDVTVMQQIASLLGKTQDAAKYQTLASEIKDAFVRKFYDVSTGVIERNSQTANAMALYMGLVDDVSRSKLLKNLIDDIQSRGNALTAGDVGYRYVLRALEESGRSDVIYDMNTRYDVPGYGWMLAHGATALTESWQAYGFVSNNHFMLGHLMEWLYSGLGGIRQASGSSAFRHIVIDPQIVGDVTNACTSYESPYGTIRCAWSLTPDGKYSLEATIPPNTDAEIVLPTDDITTVTDFGTPVTPDKTLSFSGKKLRFKVGSGNYRFVCNSFLYNASFLSRTNFSSLPDFKTIFNPLLKRGITL
jgi:hypothetical protein